MSSTLEIRLFGGMQITQNGAPVSGFLSAKAPALLAYLAYTPRPYRRESLAALLWGEMPEADARNNLRQTLSNLRKRVGAHLIITRSEVAFDTRAPHFLDVAQFDVQVQDFEDVDALQAAAVLYRGDFMDGFVLRGAPAFDEWMLAQRARYRDVMLHVLHVLTSHHLRRREYGRAVDTASRLLALDNWREEAHRQLMQALARSGQRGAALAQYETCRRILERELGISPSVETQLLSERIRAAGNRPRHNLPLSTTPFFGREAELARIDAWVNDPNSRLLTIIGPGGAGKSRLALEAVRPYQTDFLEGVWFVSLAAASGKSGMVTAMAAAIGFQFATAERLEKQLLDYLRGREMLLVLDNMEHLLRGETRSLLAALLAQAPGLKLLVTSRQRLNLRAERLLELGGLPFSSGGGTPPADAPRVTRTPAGRLFVERARQIRPAFDLAGQPHALARLCELVDGLPLALELAASWVRTLDLPAIVTALENTPDFLAADWHDAPARHRSLQALFEHSWRLLTPAEQHAFASISVFRGGFTAEAAQAVSGARLSTLAGLVDKSLLRRDEDGRYHYHALLLQFAAGKLAANPPQRERAQRAHARYYARFARQLEPVLFGGPIENALRRARPELDNLRLAWQTALEQRDTAILSDLSDALLQIFDLSGLHREMQHMAAQAIRLLEGHIDPGRDQEVLALGKAYSLSAAFLVRVGGYDQARQHSEKSLQLLARLRPHRAYAHSLLIAGAAAYTSGDLEAAVEHWQKSVEAYRQADLIWGEAAAQANLADAMLSQDDIAAAQRYATAAHTLAQQMNNTELEAVTLQMLAMVALNERDFEQATAYGKQSLALHHQVGNTMHAANALSILARIAAAHGERGQAVQHLKSSVMLLRQLGNQHALAWRLLELGRTALAAADLETAEAALLEVLQYGGDGMEHVSLRARLELARARQKQGAWQAAARLAHEVAAHPSASEALRSEALACLQSLPPLEDG